MRIYHFSNNFVVKSAGAFIKEYMVHVTELDYLVLIRITLSHDFFTVRHVYCIANTARTLMFFSTLTHCDL